MVDKQEPWLLDSRYENVLLSIVLLFSKLPIQLTQTLVEKLCSRQALFCDLYEQGFSVIIENLFSKINDCKSFIVTDEARKSDFGNHFANEKLLQFLFGKNIQPNQLLLRQT